jgi:hypothetical protein
MVLFGIKIIKNGVVKLQLNKIIYGDFMIKKNMLHGIIIFG